MNGSGSRTLLRLPRNRRRQGVIDFESCWSIAVPLQQTFICWAEALPSNLQELSRSHITEGYGEIAERVYICHQAGSSHDAAQLFQIANESIRDRLRSSLSDRPAYRVRDYGEDQPHGGSHRLVKCKK